MRVDNENEAIEPLMLEAMAWVLRFASGEVTDDDARGLGVWRAQSLAHDAAFREMVKFRSIACQLPPQQLSLATADVLPFAAPARSLSRRHFLVGGGAIAASIVGAVVVARPPLGMWPSLAELLADHRTGAGEHFTFAPTGGVEIEMNSRTAISLTGQGHAIDLVAGEAFVSVAPRSAAFEVTTDGNRLSAINATFNVQSFNDRVRVTCATGIVDCDILGQRSRLSSGERLDLSPEGRLANSTVDPVEAASWRRGILVFKGTPLSDVIAELNRYRSGPILLADSALGARPVNANFHTRRLGAAVAQIERLLNVRARILPGDVILIG